MNQRSRHKVPAKPADKMAEELPVAQPAQVVEANPTSVEVAIPLTPEEKQHLATLESVIDAKLGDFFEVGSALMEIKSKNLFRETHRNFNVYCLEHWGFGRGYANKLIGSAERIQLLPQDLPKPANEFQIRPFLKLEPAEFPKKWQAIVETADGGRITSRIVEDTLNLGRQKRGRPKGSPSGRKKGITELFASLRAILTEKKVDDALRELGKFEKLFKV